MEQLRDIQYYIDSQRVSKKLKIFLIGFILFFIVLLFLPWNQNIQARGKVSTLYPFDKPQPIQNIIPGKLEKWYVKEGDTLKKGDTIAFISEVKENLLDPQFLNRLEEQIRAKEASIHSYDGKIDAINNQISLLENLKSNKVNQTYNKLSQIHLKIISDSADLKAELNNLNISKRQLDSYEELYKKGLKSLTEVEAKRQKYQEQQAKIIVQKNKIENLKNEERLLRIQINEIESDYNEKISKSNSDKFSAISSQMESGAEIAKMKSQFSGYQQRNGFYYIVASQDGIVTQIIANGIGQTLKEGTTLVNYVPINYSLTVEIEIDPNDIPLVAKGQRAQLIFDGYPAIFFSGWPAVASGTFTSNVYAIDNYINKKGQYRVILVQNKKVRNWPSELRIGNGVKCIMLLKRVPIWYEIWRQLTGFPPDYYKSEEDLEKYK